jgi:hypothetical protein
MMLDLSQNVVIRRKLPLGRNASQSVANRRDPSQAWGDLLMPPSGQPGESVYPLPKMPGVMSVQCLAGAS